MNAPTRCVTFCFAAAALVLTAACGHEEARTENGDRTAVSTQTAVVERLTESRSIEVRGLIQPARQSFVSSRVTGPVVAIHVAAGASVRHGQQLLEIQPEAAEGQVAQATGALAQARAAHALAERNFRRFEALHASNAASDLELDMARMQLEQTEGAVAQAEGAVKAATSVAGEAIVRAPFAARVIDTLVEIGDLAAPGRPLVRVESLGGQQIWLSVRAADITRVVVGQEVPVELDTRPDLGTLGGTVTEIVPSADPATHTFNVKVDLGRVEVPSGLSGRAKVPGDVAERLVVPATAVHQRGGLELVVVRAGDGTARTRAVTTGAVIGDGRIEILSGLAEGEIVAVDIHGPVADGTVLEARS